MMAATYELIASQVLGSAAATVTFSSIPGTFDDLLIVGSVRTSRASLVDFATVAWNGSTANYSYRRLDADGSAVSSNSSTGTSTVVVAGNTSTSNTFGSYEIYMPNYAGSTNKSYSVTSMHETNAATALMEIRAFLWSDTSAISSVVLESLNSANFVTNSSFQIYGITKA